MLKLLADRLGLPTAVVILLLVILVIQVALQIYSLLDLAKRHPVPGGQKWPWAVLIVAGNLLGAIAYLAIGRSGPLTITDQGAGTAEARKQALDRLYGDRDRR
ncbi:MAG: PLD nuclease N-terminal domain-containing protein [Gemmatimonadales bacterium]